MSSAHAPRRLFPHRRSALLLVPLLLGCHSWQRQPLPTSGSPDQVIAGRVRAVWTDGAPTVATPELTRARLTRDTLYAEHYVIRRGRGPVMVTVPVDSIRRLEVRRLSWGRSLGLVLGIWLGVGTLGATLCC
jgi:hypothetical protein